MIRAALVMLSLLLAPQPAGAETVRVLSGEHPGFTRLAFVFEAPTAWRFGRVDPGADAEGGQGAANGEGARFYELRLERAGIDLDISQVFRRAPRTRLSDLETRGDVLRLIVAPGHRAVPFDLRPGAMAIDIRTGPPPPDSPFEQRLAPEPTARSQAPTLPASSADTKLRAPEREGAPSGAYWSDWAEFLWRRAGPDGSAVGAGPARAAIMSAAAPGTLDAAVRDTAPGPKPQTPGAAARGVDMLEGLAPFAFDPFDGGVSREPDDTGPSAALHGPRRAAATPGSAPDIPVADTARARALILEQVARAASQGLIVITGPDLSAFADTGPNTDPRASTAEHDQLNVRAQTSMDRDGFARVRHALRGLDAGCAEPEAFDIAAWGRGREPAGLIAEGRLALLGEFDRVRSGAVAELARRYLYLGFGAEAAALIRSFPGAVADEALFLSLAAIMDGRLPTEGSLLPGLTRCDSAAALWALLSRAPDAQAPDLNVAAALRSFSDLPGHLRAYLASPVVERLIAHGRIDAAASVRNAVDRLAGDAPGGTELLEARIALEAGAVAGDMFPQAEERLLSVIGDGGPDTVPALLLYLDERLARGLPVTAVFAEQAATLAFEHRNAAEGPALRRAEILARAAAGDFPAAFDALERARAWAEGRDVEATTPDVLTPLFDLVARAPDVAFLNHTLALQEADAAALATETAARISLRLLDLGFPAEARRLRLALGEADSDTRLFLAQADLDLGQPRQALQAIAGMEGVEADRLRARALADIGAAAEAARIFSETGDDENAAHSAWLAQDWAAYRGLRSDARSVALERLGQSLPEGETTASVSEVPSDALASMPAGVLARNRALIGQSREIRAALGDLRASLPGTEAK
jgi:hypothetical protein